MRDAIVATTRTGQQYGEPKPGAALDSHVACSGALGGPRAEPVRARLRRTLADDPDGTVVVVTFLELVERLGRRPGDSSRRPSRRFIVLDLQRLVLFHDSGTAGEPGISSLVRFLLDGYPLQPFETFAAAERRTGYSFAFDLAALDLVAQCLRELKPGHYGVLDLLTGEISLRRLLRHPQAADDVRITAPSNRPAASPLRPVVTDRTLRARPPPRLADLMGDSACVIRQETLPVTHSPLAYARTAVICARGTDRQFCYGAALRPDRARAIAECEALERFLVTYQPNGIELVRASYEELDDAVDPRQLFFGRSPECPADDGDVFDPAAPLCWTWAWGPAERRWRLVPAQELWFSTPQRMSEPRFVRATTSGCAMGSTLEEAAVWGALEAIERDAFLTSWYLRRPASEIDLESSTLGEMHDLVSRFPVAFPNYRAVLVDLTSDVGVPTVGAFAFREHSDGPRAFVAAAAHVDAEQACYRAFKDLTMFTPAMSVERRAELRERLTVLPSSPEAHFELYAIDESFGAFDYLELDRRPKIAVAQIGDRSPVPRSRQLRLDDLLESLDRRFREVGAALFVTDFRSPLTAEAGLCAARVVTPGLYPIWFGGKHRRFAVTERLRRLALAYTGRPFRVDRLQLEPHPMP